MKEKSAFCLGFLDGLAKPFSLFVEPEEIEPVEIKQVKTKIGGIASDWAKLGGDMRRAMGYVETLSAIQEAEDIASGKIQTKSYKTVAEMEADLDAEED